MPFSKNIWNQKYFPQESFNSWRAEGKHQLAPIDEMVTKRNVIKTEVADVQPKEKENGKLTVTFGASGGSRNVIIGVLSAVAAIFAIIILVKIYLFFASD